MRVTDALQDPNTLGLVIPQFDLVVHLTKEALSKIPAAIGTGVRTGVGALIVSQVKKWISANRPRTDDDCEIVPILGPDGRTIKTVRTRNATKKTDVHT
jgi:hypothetical protein